MKKFNLFRLFKEFLKDAWEDSNIFERIFLVAIFPLVFVAFFILWLLLCEEKYK